MSDCVLAIDQGTSGSTVLVVDAAGQIVGRGYREITQHYPEPGWVEHDPEEDLAQDTRGRRRGSRGGRP